MREFCVIVGMDWMDSYDAEIICRHKKVRVRTPSGGELLVQGDLPRRTVALCSAARARQYLQHSGTGYLAYVVDTYVNEEKKSVDEVSVIQEFSTYFPMTYRGYLPSDRWNSEST